MALIDAWVATAAKQKLVRQQIDLGPLGAEDVEVEVAALRPVSLRSFGAEQRLGHFAVPGSAGARSRRPGDRGRIGGQGPCSRPACGHRLDGRQLHALQAVHVGRSTPVPAGATDDRRPSRRVRQPRPLALGLGAAAAGANQLRRGRPAPVRRHHRLQSTGDVRQTDQPRRHRRHRRPGPHGRQVRRRLWLRRDGLHLQRKQVRRGPRLRRQPRRLKPRFGGDQGNWQARSIC